MNAYTCHNDECTKKSMVQLWSVGWHDPDQSSFSFCEIHSLEAITKMMVKYTQRKPRL